MKNMLKTNKANEEIVEQFIDILSSPDEKFNKIYPNMKRELSEIYKTDAVRAAILEELKTASDITIQDEIDEANRAIEEIKQDDLLSDNKKDLLISMYNESIKIISELIKNPRERITVKVVKVNPDAILPTYAHETDGGADISAVEEITIKPHTTEIIPTGLKMAVPPGYMINIIPRSGLSLKTNLRIANAFAVIDAEYRGEVGVIVTNTGNLSYTIKKGDKIAQMLINPTPMIRWEEVKELDKTERGESGYGSTDQS